MSDEQTQDEIIGAKEAMEQLDVTQPTLYRWIREGRIPATKAGREWRFRQADVDAFLRGETPSRELPGGFQELVDALAAQVPGDELSAGDDPIAAVVEMLIWIAADRHASDLHVEAGPSGRVRMRIDGLLQDLVTVAEEHIPLLVKRLKVLAACNVTIDDLPQDGRVRGGFGDKQLDFRVAFVPTVHGEEAVVRFMPTDQQVLDLDQLRLEPEHLATIKAALAKPYGLHLSVGPTGSGKTTTAYAMIKHLHQPGVKVMTVEDPIAYVFPGISQIPIRNPNHMSAAHALRAVMRCDPDVVFVEIKTADLAAIACDGALSGHAIIAQMHCNSVVGAWIRLRDLGVSAEVLAEALGVTVSQRLLRRPCRECARPATLTPDDRNQIAELAVASGLGAASLSNEWLDAVGCDRCNGTGYRGRIAVNEVGCLTSALTRALIAGADHDELTALAIKEGIVDLRGEGLRRASTGQTTLAELRRVILASN